ncbi:MAG: hypothetical protein ACJ76H_11430 [Bacteriovoracaceae bacterium]
MNVEETEILAELASRGLLEAFYEAVDADDFVKVVQILRSVDIDDETIKNVLEEIDS